MKRIVLILVLTLFSELSAQSFDCHNVDRYQLTYIYQQNENKFKFVSGGIDYMKKVVENLPLNTMKQICINNWGVYQQNGKDYMCSCFVNNYGYIDKSYYYNNITYLELLGYFKFKIKSRVK